MFGDKDVSLSPGMGTGAEEACTSEIYPLLSEKKGGFGEVRVTFLLLLFSPTPSA